VAVAAREAASIDKDISPLPYSWAGPGRKCIFTWYWLTDLCVQEGIPFVLGHALSMKAIHGGKATNDRIDAHKIAVLWRGGMRPQAYVYPAARRATRDLLRRRHTRWDLWQEDRPGLPHVGLRRSRRPVPPPQPGEPASPSLAW
jgi:hypothetical protein